MRIVTSDLPALIQPSLEPSTSCAEIIQRGAIGIGEMKYHVAVDSPEMHRVYKLAEEMQVPVLLHFEYETYNTGFERFDKVLKAYPKVNFIGHAQTWWGNISAGLISWISIPRGP